MIELIATSVVYVILCYFVACRINNVRLSTINLFFINVVLTPVGTILLINLAKDKFENKMYHYKCPKCEYCFTEKVPACPLCEKEGVKTQLEKVKILLA